MASTYNSSGVESDAILDVALSQLGSLYRRVNSTNETDSGNMTVPSNHSTTAFPKNITSTPSGGSSNNPLQTSTSDSSIIAKITLLLVVTAVVLIASYKFVVRLFLGYADRKDEVFPDGFSDDEDSAVVKRIATGSLDIG